jgi:hypothetical protein
MEETTIHWQLSINLTALQLPNRVSLATRYRKQLEEVATGEGYLNLSASE